MKSLLMQNKNTFTTFRLACLISVLLVVGCFGCINMAHAAKVSNQCALLYTQFVKAHCKDNICLCTQADIANINKELSKNCPPLVKNPCECKGKLCNKK